MEKWLDFNPCAHPGGSDLPGTKATFEASLYLGDTFEESQNPLHHPWPGRDAAGARGDLRSPARVDGRAGPDHHRLDRGDGNQSGSWQTGVKQIKLTDFDTGAVLGDQIFGEEALPCAQKAWSKGLDVFYTVPEDAPPEIRLMVEAFDFAEKRGSFGLSYFTGEVWKGTANVTSSVVVYTGGGTCRDGWELEFTFVASAEGTIDGQGTAELTSAPTCPFPITSPSWNHVEYQVLGEETAGGFSLPFALGAWEPADGANWAGFSSMFGLPALPSGGLPVAVAVWGTSGTGQGVWQFQSGTPSATYSANGTITLECVNCEEAVG